MSIESLAKNLIAARTRSQDNLNSGDIGSWLDGIADEIRASDAVRNHLLNHSIAISDDPDVREVLQSIDLSDIDDPDKTGSELLFSWISPSEYVVALAQGDLEKHGNLTVFSDER